MLALEPGQIEAWIAHAYFPFVRIGACLMVAPIFGARFVPARARVTSCAATLSGPVIASVGRLHPRYSKILPL